MKLRLLFFGWTVIFSVLTLGAQTVLTGPCGGGGGRRVYWVLSDDRSVLTFSGDDTIINLGWYARYPFQSYHGYNGVGDRAAMLFNPIPFSDDVPVSVVYEDGVKSTGEAFFFSQKGENYVHWLNVDVETDGKYDCITSVKFGRTINKISSLTFYGCAGLTEIDFGGPEQVTIGDRAFGRTSIKKMFIPNNVILEKESLMLCPLEQVVITNPVPTVEKSYIGQIFYRNGIYQQDEGVPVTEVYVPDADAYSAWEPTPKPMLKKGKYSLDDAALGNITIASNIPGYEASTDYRFDQLDEGVYTVWLPVKFTGERDFETTVKYTYTVGNPLASVDNVANDNFSVKASGGALVVSGATAPVAVFNMTGQKVYEGKENQIALPGGIYVVTSGGRTVKIRL